MSGSNYASLRHPDGPTTPAGLTAANVSSWHPTGQLTFDPNGGSLPLIHGTAWARALIDTHSEHGTMLRLARLAWHTRDLPNGSPYAFSIGEGTQLIVSGKGRLAPEAFLGGGGGAVPPVTAGLVGGAQWAVVRGPGTVHLLDLSGAYEVRIETDTNVFEAEVAGDGLGLFSLANVTLHQLTAGDRIDLNTGRHP